LTHRFGARTPCYLFVVADIFKPTTEILYMVYEILSAKERSFRLEYAASNLDDFETNIHDDP
jgi:hypothetical protein